MVFWKLLDKDKIKLEQKIALAQGVGYACLTGNGTLSIVLSLEEYGLINKQLLIQYSKAKREKLKKWSNLRL